MIVIVALADFMLSATDVAVSVTVAGVGTLAGALYVTLVAVTFVRVPAPLRLQVTPLFAPAFCTEAVNPAVFDT